MYLFVARREMVDIVLLDGGRYQFCWLIESEGEREGGDEVSLG